MPTARLRRWIVLLTLALVAYFLARGAVTLLAEALPAAPRARLASARSALPARGELELASLEHLAGLTSGLPAPPPPAARACAAPRRLIATVVDRGDEGRSFAAIASASGRTELLGPGASWGEMRLAQIDEGAVLIEEGGESCVLPLFDAAPSTPAAPPASPAVDGVRPIDEHTVEIDRALASRLASDPTPILGELRAIPHEAAGQIVGYRLYGIRAGSLTHAIGLRNGDTLRAVDGTVTTDLGAMLALAERLQRAVPEVIHLELERRGSPVTLELRIR